MANNQGTTRQDWGGNAGSRTNAGGNRGQTGGAGNAGVMDKAQDAVSGAVDSAKEWASNAADTAKDWASNATERTQECVSDAAKHAGEYYGVARDAVVGAEENLEMFIRRNPIMSLMIAFGAGALIGMAVCRRD
jgi:ElaB/YqjD/DUF883 family membrane-anchored ribosome-binding protein